MSTSVASIRLASGSLKPPSSEPGRTNTPASPPTSSRSCGEAGILCSARDLPHPLLLLGDDDAAEARAQPAVHGLEEGGQAGRERLHRPGLRRDRPVDLDAVQPAPEQGQQDRGRPPSARRSVTVSNPQACGMSGVRYVAPRRPRLQNLGDLALALLPPRLGLASARPGRSRRRAADSPGRRRRPGTGRAGNTPSRRSRPRSAAGRCRPRPALPAAPRAPPPGRPGWPFGEPAPGPAVLFAAARRPPATAASS